MMPQTSVTVLNNPATISMIPSVCACRPSLVMGIRSADAYSMNSNTARTHNPIEMGNAQPKVAPNQSRPTTMFAMPEISSGTVTPLMPG